MIQLHSHFDVWTDFESKGGLKIGQKGELFLLLVFHPLLSVANVDIRSIVI